MLKLRLLRRPESAVAPVWGRCMAAVSARQLEGASRGPMTSLSLTCASSASQSIWSTFRFHRLARTPPATRTLAISGPATSVPNQCIALLASTASTDAYGSGLASAPPGKGADSRQRAPQLGLHRRVELERDSLHIQRDKCGGEFAGSSAEGEHSQARRQPRTRAPSALRLARSLGDARRMQPQLRRTTTCVVTVRPVQHDLPHLTTVSADLDVVDGSVCEARKNAQGIASASCDDRDVPTCLVAVTVSNRVDNPRSPDWSCMGPTRKSLPGQTQQRRRLVVAIKILHSVIFLVNSSSVLLIFWQGISGHGSRFSNVALAAALSESAVFVVNKGRCPLTDLVEQLGAEDGRVSDIFLPKWFADRIPCIFGPLLVIGLALRVWRSRRSQHRA
jgi:hypothetical protein